MRAGNRNLRHAQISLQYSLAPSKKAPEMMLHGEWCALFNHLTRSFRLPCFCFFRRTVCTRTSQYQNDFAYIESDHTSAGIGGIGSGEEDENENDWEVSMHLDSGCSEYLKARKEGNPGWKRLPSVTCIPNKRQNPMMWPFDAPGKAWLHDSTDSSKDADHWPYKESNLRDFVESAPDSPAWSDGVW